MELGLEIHLYPSPKSVLLTKVIYIILILNQNSYMILFRNTGYGKNLKKERKFLELLISWN